MINYLHLDDIDNMTINEIKERIRYLSESNAQLCKQLNEFNSQEEVAKAHKEVEEIRKKSYTFSDEDWKTVNTFVKNHYNMNTHYKNPLHSISYIFTPTEVWDCAEVVCTCGKKLQFFY